MSLTKKMQGYIVWVFKYASSVFFEHEIEWKWFFCENRKLYNYIKFSRSTTFSEMGITEAFQNVTMEQINIVN